jgi:hypothetical protein
LEDVDILWGFELPQLANASHMAEVNRGIAEHGIQLLIVDPLYLCLLAGLAGETLDARNLFQMGPLFVQISKSCISAGCTPLLIHHTIKRPPNPFEPLDLKDLAYAGVQESARQWILLSPRERYEPGTGLHKLWLEYGGSLALQQRYRDRTVHLFRCFRLRGRRFFRVRTMGSRFCLDWRAARLRAW